MLCYRDRQFCSAQCKTPGCPDAITPDVQRAAEAWSQSFGVEGGLIMQADMSSRCPDYQPSDA